MTEPSSERETLAIAFLTGQASVAEASEFVRLFADDVGFRELVSELDVWLRPLRSDTSHVEPPAGLLDDLLESLPAMLPPPAQPQAGPRPAARVHWLWRPAALVAAAAAVVALAAPALYNSVDAPGAAVPVTASTDSGSGFVAALAGSGDAQVIVIVYDPGEQRILARYSNVAPPEDGVWQLWLIRDGLPAPQSIGLISRETSADGEAELQFSEPLRPAGDLLAISLEPEGGSPQPGPTGPVLFTGKVSNLS